MLKTNEEIMERMCDLMKRKYPDQSADMPKYYQWSCETVKLSAINQSDCAVPIDSVKVKRYAKLLKNGAVFPPIICLNLGGYALFDGIHRLLAYKMNNQETVTIYSGKIN